MGPLAGVKVVEFAGVGPGPFCAMLLADLGAHVIRVTRTTESAGADGSGIGSITEGILTRGRTSVGIDLKHPDGVAAALELIASADALIEGFRPGVMERLGLGPAACLERNRQLVYGRLTGWGQEGPYAHASGHDINFIALSGLLGHVGRRGERPVPPLNVVGDFAGGGMLLALGIVAAVLEASRSGEGQVVDAAMVDGSAYLMTMMYELLGRGGWVEEREANPNDGGAHFYDVYETADGEYVSVAAMEPKFYAELLQRLGMSDEDLPDQWDRSGWPALKERFADVFRQRTREEWCALLEGTDTCFAPVLTMSEAITHPHNVHREMFVEVDGVMCPAPAPRFSRTPASLKRTPESAEDDRDPLLDWGMSQGRLEELRRAGVLAGPSAP